MDNASKNDQSADSQSHPYSTKRTVNLHDRENQQRGSILFGGCHDEIPVGHSGRW